MKASRETLDTHRFLLASVFLVAVSSCGDDTAPAPDVPPLPDVECEGLFGAPNENTGLSDAQCFPWVVGMELWEPRSWTSTQIEQLRAWKLENPPPVLTEDPYVTMPDAQPRESAACAVMVEAPASYRLQTFESLEAAELAGGIVTHGNGCGACSSLLDLAAYIETPDQTGPVRLCTLENLAGTVEELQACIEQAVGFSAPCARAWAYNSMNTSQDCLAVCLEEVDSPYNQPDGSLNPCLQCDEQNSGPVFKAIAGRTRRNSGVPAAICRPCDQVWRIAHDYP